ncbi:conserved hypothetical protein [Brucella abortus NCTC 8038]|nr:conserved hypothetical protein [Brucella abortus NCTC 8038]
MAGSSGNSRRHDKSHPVPSCNRRTCQPGTARSFSCRGRPVCPRLSAPLAGSTHADCGCAALFELLQRITPGRHGEFHDFLFKAAGAAIGVAVGHSLSRLRPFRQIE